MSKPPGRARRLWTWANKPTPKMIERSERLDAKTAERLAKIDQKGAERQQQRAARAEQQSLPLSDAQKAQRDLNRSSKRLMWLANLEIAALLLPVIVSIVIFVVVLTFIYLVI